MLDIKCLTWSQWNKASAWLPWAFDLAAESEKGTLGTAGLGDQKWASTESRLASSARGFEWYTLKYTTETLQLEKLF